MAGEDRLDLRLPKVVYVLMTLVSLSVAVYKLGNLGMLPTTPSDWIEFLHQAPVRAGPRWRLLPVWLTRGNRAQPLEYSTGGLAP